MQIKKSKFSILALILLTMACACLVAILASYGRNVLWAVTRIGSPRHAAFVQTELSPKVASLGFVRCDFRGLSFDLPSGMAGTAKIHTSGAMRCLEFSEGDRLVRVVLSSNSANRSVFGTLPTQINAETAGQLLHRIYTADTRDCSLNMSYEQLLLHEWTLKYRDALAYARHFDQISFDASDGLHIATLSADPQLSSRSSKMKRLICWSTQDGTNGGMIYILDAEGTTGSWGDRVAASLEMRQESTLDEIDFLSAPILRSLRK